MFFPDFDCSDIAYRVIDAYDISIPILDIDSVVRSLGGLVLGYPREAAGRESTICKTGKDSFCIHTAQSKKSYSRTFSIAHDLGHLYLHMGFRTNPKRWNSLEDGAAFYRPMWSVLELETNGFAASFLMPEEVYKQVLRKNIISGQVDIAAVAQAFHAPISAVLNRGRNLRLIK